MIVDSAWVGEVGPSGPEEEEMLSMNPERQPTSRLSCQVKVCESLDGLTVHLPESQW
ncbi:Ferredoxin-6 [Nocardioides sp. T2.26MG-1]|nr:Ferredoxin-6 [Nocardioides sp. T2.26MG-1]